jgi:hypothetical protein
MIMSLYDTLASQPSPPPDLDAIRAAADAAMAATAIHEAEARRSAVKHDVALRSVRNDIAELEKTIRATAVAFIVGFLLHAAALVAAYNMLKDLP